ISDEMIEKYKPAKDGEVRLWSQDQDEDNISSKIWSDFSDHYKTMLTGLLELERVAFKRGYTFAVAFFAGRCMLCEKCNVENVTCLNPRMARFSPEAMGINVLKTAKNAGMDLKFYTEDTKTAITPVAILLID
ncbi:MAG: DUF2284 domain-containing protein, partial [Methanobacterium paludis]|nr:DUF2284 domain-containing protein [Methanobacterium paludis]